MSDVEIQHASLETLKLPTQNSEKKNRCSPLRDLPFPSFSYLFLLLSSLMSLILVFHLLYLVCYEVFLTSVRIFAALPLVAGAVKLGRH